MTHTDEFRRRVEPDPVEPEEREWPMALQVIAVIASALGVLLMAALVVIGAAWLLS